MHYPEKQHTIVILLCCFICWNQSTFGQGKQGRLQTGLYTSVKFSSFKYIDIVSRDTLYLDSIPICSVADFKEVSVVTETLSGRPVMEIRLGEIGTQKFAKATRENIAKKIAVIGKGRLLAAPVVTSEIAGGRLVVSGNFTFEEINGLVDRIRKDIPGYKIKSEEEQGKEQTIIDVCNGLDRALVQGDSVRLNKLLHQRLSFGHSNGLIEDKETLLEHIRNAYLKYNDIVEEGHTEIQFVQQVATVRRHLNVHGSLEGKTFGIQLKVLEVWIEEHKEWKLLCRQSVKTN